MANASHSFRKNYEKGVEQFYESHGDHYRNPHEPVLRKIFRNLLGRWSRQISFRRTLDLACGSGEASLFVKEFFEKQGFTVAVGTVPEELPEGQDLTIFIEGADPFTADAFEERLGVAASTYSFEDIEEGVLSDRGVRYDTIICSYALHLVEPTRMLGTCQQLAMSAAHLIVVTPHKKPDITVAMGWVATEEYSYFKQQYQWIG